MRTLSEIRATGRADLSGRWVEAAMLTFVFYIIVGAFAGVCGWPLNLRAPGSGSALSLVLLPMGWSYFVIFLSNHRREDNDPFAIGHLFDGYRNGQFLRIFTTTLLVDIYTILWSLLLIVPGIIKSLSYSMTSFILRDRSDLRDNAAIELSMDMMKGHKLELFWLYLSFIGWFILCCFTLGIGFFWLVPYTSASLAAFYEDVKQDYELRYGGAEGDANGTTDNYQK